MERIESIKHPREAFFLALSRTLERTSYFGVRTLIVLYLIDITFSYPREEALEIYALFSFAVIISKVVGGIIGDLLLGNRISVLFGGLLQSVGTFILCIPTTTSFFLGLMIIVIGGGLYTPNLLAEYGKFYFNKIRLLDAGYTVIFLAGNLGYFIGFILVGSFEEESGYRNCFLILGGLMLLSLIPLLILRKSSEIIAQPYKKIRKKRVYNMVFVLIIIGVFWSVYNFTSIRPTEVKIELQKLSALNIPFFVWSSLEKIVTLLILFVAIIFWSLFYISHSHKLLMSSLAAAIAFGILFFVPEVIKNQYVFYFIIFLFFNAIAEVTVLPITYSIVIKYADPKYLAIFLSVADILVGVVKLLFLVLFGILNFVSHSLLTGIVSMFAIAFIIVLYLFLKGETDVKRLES